MCVVEHEQERGRSGQGLREARQDLLVHRRITDAQQTEHLLVHTAHRIQSERQIGQQDDRIVVALIELQPRDPPNAASGELAQKCALAGAGGGGDQDQRRTRPGQRIDQSLAMYERKIRARGTQFGAQRPETVRGYLRARSALLRSGPLVACGVRHGCPPAALFSARW